MTHASEGDGIKLSWYYCPKNSTLQIYYYRDIRPIFETVCKNAWVNKMGFIGHGPDKPGNFLDYKLEEKLSKNKGQDEKNK